MAELDIIIYFANSLFSARPWILNTKTSRYIINDLLVFISTQNLPSLISIIGIIRKSGAIALGIIKLLYRTLDSSVNLIINDVLYLLGTSANLILVSKLQRAGCPLVFINRGISIGRNGVLTKLYNNDLYYIEVNADTTALYL